MASVARLAPLLLLAGGALFGGSPARAAEDEQRPNRNLEPLPRAVAFGVTDEGRFNVKAAEIIEHEIQRTFASLGEVTGGRALLVRRFGVLSVPALRTSMVRAQNVTETWNAILTVGALRDAEGAAVEIKAALKPLLRHLTDIHSEIHIRGFAALTLGCFPWPEGVVPKRYREMVDWYNPVPGPALATDQAARTLQEARRGIVLRVSDKQMFNSVAALFALAKMGGEDARKELLANLPAVFANSAPKRALLLARAFLREADSKPFFGPDGLKNDESRIRSSAALALAVAMLQVKPAAWTLDGGAMLKKLRTTHPLASSDDENVFARGVCAYVNQQNEQWKKLWECAITPSTKRNCAGAASQMLIFCELPWFKEAVVKQAAKPGDSMKEPVLALSLLRAGRAGTPEARDVTLRWLKSKSRRPASNSRWDPRWYAAIGLLRALQDGRLSGQAERVEAIETLRGAVEKTIHKSAAIHPVLERVLAEHGDRITAPKDAALYRLPRAALDEVEQSFVCPYGLLAGDPIDACVRRVNDALWEVFGLNALTPNKPGEVRQQPQRYLKRYLEAYPYFSRLEFLPERGFRPLPAYEPGPLVIDR